MTPAEMALAFALAGGILVAGSVTILARHLDARIDLLLELQHDLRRELHHLQGEEARHRHDEHAHRSAVAFERMRRHAVEGAEIDAARARRLRAARRKV